MIYGVTMTGSYNSFSLLPHTYYMQTDYQANTTTLGLKFLKSDWGVWLRIAQLVDMAPAQKGIHLRII